MANPDNLEGMAKFGMAVDKRLGVSVSEMRRVAREIGKDHELAFELWKTSIAEARIVASMIAVPEQLTGEDMDAWVRALNS